MEKRKIAICFWGLTRSLKNTLQSIKENIFDVLLSYDIEFDIYLHTYKLYNPYNNFRSGEDNIYLDNEEYKLLNPNFFMVEDQDVVKEHLNLIEYRTHEDPWNTEYQTCDNFICALYSKFQIIKMLKDNNIKYNNIIFCRPDVKFLNNFPISFLITTPESNVIHTPNFHQFKGLNDRFFVSNYKNSIIYGEAFKYLKEYSKIRNIHSETFFKNYLIETNNLISEEIPFYFNRIRSNGNISKDINNNLLKNIVKIFGVYFICCIGNYLKIVSEQLNTLCTSDLYDNTKNIYCFVCLSNPDILSLLSKYTKIVIINSDENLKEKFAINNYCNYLPKNENYYLYYLHSKGVSRKEKSFNDWRLLCDHFTLTKWKINVLLLQRFNCVGINYLAFPKKHFSGNFWWTKSEYINTLPLQINDNRLSPEMYICDSIAMNPICIYNKFKWGIEHPQELYINLTNSDILNNCTNIAIENHQCKRLIIEC